ncbi:hypothetical protein X749_31380 [Mesorhizobium sp. LNJC391B00]|nr:hypothetical protein X749_31380 [Mesorhizobium sp. LNJC391B00]
MLNIVPGIQTWEMPRLFTDVGDESSGLFQAHARASWVWFEIENQKPCSISDHAEKILCLPDSIASRTEVVGAP